MLAPPIRRKWGSTDFAELDYSMGTIKADTTIVVDVRVEHLGDKPDGGRFSWVLLSELQFEFKEATIPGSSFWPFDKGSPVVKVSFFRRGVDAFVLFFAELVEVSNQSFLSGIAHQTYKYY